MKKKKYLKKRDLRYVASLGKITELEKSEDPDTTGKGCGPRQSQPCLLHCVLCCSDWNMYSQQPVLGSECCWKQGSSSECG